MAAAYIFDTIADFKEHVGGGVNQSLHLGSIKPTMLAAFRNHIRAWLGDAQWNILVTNADAPSQEEEALIEYVRTPLAMLTMYEYSKIGSVEFGEMGLHRTETEDRKGAYKYQENEYREYMLRNGYEALEQMLSFLEDNEADYPLWQISAGYDRNKSLYINTASDFRDAYSFNIDRYTYESFRALMADVETFAILPVLGSAQHQALKAAIKAKNATSEQNAIINLIQKAVAHFTVELAAIRNWVTIKDNALHQVNREGDQGLLSAAPASDNSVSALLSQNNLLANRHISYLKQYLSDNIDNYPLYSAYLTAQAAAEEEESSTTTPSLDDPRYFGAYNFSDSNRHSTKKRTSVKRL